MVKLFRAASLLSLLLFGGSGSACEEVERFYWDNAYLVGFSVSIFEDRALVSSPFGQHKAVYFFVQDEDSGLWISEQSVLGEELGDEGNFGWSVSLHGSRALVGAHRGNPYSQNQYQGAAYVLGLGQDGVWGLEAKLLANIESGDQMGQLGDLFGWSVSLRGERCLVSAMGEESSRGSAYVFFKDDGGEWQQEAQLSAPGGGMNQQFGYSLALSDGRALIGAPGENSNKGAAYLFAKNNDGNSWDLEQRLSDPAGAIGAQFGKAVALHASHALVTQLNNGQGGLAFLYRNTPDNTSGNTPDNTSGNTPDNTSGNTPDDTSDNTLQSNEWQLQTLLQPDEEVFGFGLAAALHHNHALISAVKFDNTGSVFLFSSDSQWTQPPQQTKLQAMDGAQPDSFGYSVSLHNTHALISAYTAVQNGISEGGAYLFRCGPVLPPPLPAPPTLTNSPSMAHSHTHKPSFSPTISSPPSMSLQPSFAFAPSPSPVEPFSQVQKLTFQPQDKSFSFGYSTSIYQNRVIISAPLGAEKSVYIYINTPPLYEWVLEQRLMANDVSELGNFGWSVSLYKNRAIVSSPFSPSQSRGIVYSYIHMNDKWNFDARILPINGDANDNFGWSVSLYENKALIGATGSTTIQGAAYIFNADNNWDQEAKLTSIVQNNAFGQSVSLWNNKALVGASDENQRGAAYLYSYNHMWVLEKKFFNVNAPIGASYGSAVSLHNDRALISEPNGNTSELGTFGKAHIYAHDEYGWFHEAELMPDIDTDGFGHSVSLHDKRALIGILNSPNSSYLFSFEEEYGTWMKESLLTSNDGIMGDMFGWSVSLSDHCALISALYSDNDWSTSGAAYIFHDSSKMSSMSNTSMNPSSSPLPSHQPSSEPSSAPQLPSSPPSFHSSTHSSMAPSMQDSMEPSMQGSMEPSMQGSMEPSMQGSMEPSMQGSMEPSMQGSMEPSMQGSMEPSMQGSMEPSMQGSMEPSMQGSMEPSMQDSMQSSMEPSMKGSMEPSMQTSMEPSMQDSMEPSMQGSMEPSMQDSMEPSMQESMKPSMQSSMEPSA